jgi:hypothetical protein
MGRAPRTHAEARAGADFGSVVDHDLELPKTLQNAKREKRQTTPDELSCRTSPIPIAADWVTKRQAK